MKRTIVWRADLCHAILSKKAFFIKYIFPTVRQGQSLLLNVPPAEKYSFIFYLFCVHYKGPCPCPCPSSISISISIPISISVYLYLSLSLSISLSISIDFYIYIDLYIDLYIYIDIYIDIYIYIDVYQSLNSPCFTSSWTTIPLPLHIITVKRVSGIENININKRRIEYLSTNWCKLV